MSGTVEPKTAAPGQTLTITATVLAPNGGQPIAGVQCYLRAPANGQHPLFQIWPQPATTNATGTATWHLTVPQVSPGVYGVEIVAYGAKQWSYVWDLAVTVTIP